MFKDDFLTENKIQTAVIDVMEHEAKSNEIHQNDQMHILNLDPPTSNHTKRDDKQINCDIVILMDPNRKFIQKKTNYFQVRRFILFFMQQSKNQEKY